MAAGVETPAADSRVQADRRCEGVPCVAETRRLGRDSRVRCGDIVKSCVREVGGLFP